MATPRVMAPWTQARVTPDPTMVLSLSGQWVTLVQRDVTPGIRGALRRAWQSVAGKPPEPGFDESAYVAGYLDQAVNRMSNTPDQVYAEITRQIAQGIAAGESQDQLAARVQGVFDVSGNPWWDNRAATVARTESQGALNAGSLAGAGARQAATGQPMVKVWKALDQPGRTRPAHLKADGQAQPLTNAFKVGAEALQYPGDPRGSADTVINCRCTMTFRHA